MLLIHARRDARTGPDGGLVLLDDQDRGRWDRTMIEEGRGLVVVALTGGPPGPYGVQAAIAALHDEAANVATTDWPQIVALYDVLLVLTPSPIVALNRAAAVAMRDGPEAGLALLDELAGEPRLRGYPRTRRPGPTCCSGSAASRGRGGLPGGARPGRQRARAGAPAAQTGRGRGGGPGGATGS
nr:hypothetical protein GCM10020093_102770 [Planobispora longispora]